MSDAGKPYDEKRDFIRMKIPAPLQASLTGPEGSFQAKCTELSGGGMQIELDQNLSEGEEYEVNMVSEHGHSPELHARVRVVRVRQDGDRHLAGLEILEVLG